MSDEPRIPGFDFPSYLNGLQWSEHATEHEKALVIGNLRTLHAEIARVVPDRDTVHIMRDWIDSWHAAKQQRGVYQRTLEWLNGPADPDHPLLRRDR